MIPVRDARRAYCVFLFILTVFAFSAASALSQDCTIYVDSDSGDDVNHTGQSGSPWRSLQMAANNSGPGSVICAQGIFKDRTPGDSQVLLISISGREGQPIVFQSDPAAQSPAVIQMSASDWAGIVIKKVGTTAPAYIQINNFNVIGINALSNDAIWSNYQCTVGQTATAQEALPPPTPDGAQDTSPPPQTLEPPCSAYAIEHPVHFPQYSGNGIFVDGTAAGQVKDKDISRPHHIWITLNEVHECAGGGIVAIQSDYVIAQYNTVYNNVYYTAYGSSGISFLNAWDSYADGGVAKDLNFANFNGYHMIVDSNKVFNNFEYVPWGSYLVNNVAQITDGEGIIFDSFLNSSYKDNVSLSAYGPQSLISNNLVYGNGSAGIEVYQTNNVDVLQNSTYGNSANVIPSWTDGGNESSNGEFNVGNSHNLTVMNNIFEPLLASGGNPGDPQQYSLKYNGLSNAGQCWCYFANNDLYNGLISTDFPNGDLGPYLTYNPQYLNTDLTHIWDVDLQLTPNSPLLEAGQTWYVPSQSNNPNTAYPISVVGNGYPVTNGLGTSPRPNPPDIGAWQK